MPGKGRGKGRSEKIVPGFARGRGSAAFRDPHAETDPSAVPCGENPAGLFAHQGALYISESVNDRVVRVQGDVRTIVAGGNGKGKAANQFDRPFRIFVNDDGLYVSDRNNARVQFWPHGATSGKTVAGGNGPGHGPHQLNQPAGVAIDGQSIYVADRANHRIMRWAFGSREGIVVAGGNGFGSGQHQLGCPGALCIVDSILYISDESNARVQCWIPGEQRGSTIAGGQGNGSSSLQLYHPLGICAFGDEDLLICDSTNHRVQQLGRYKVDGNACASTVCGGFGIGSGPNQLGHPMDCHWDGERLYVSDWYHACVRTYTKEILDANSMKPPEGQAQTQCDSKRYTGRVTEWRDHGGYGFVIDDTTNERFMAHNSDIANSLVKFGYAVLTAGEHVEYFLLRDIVGKWKCDAVTAVGGGPVSPEQHVLDMSINSGTRSYALTNKHNQNPSQISVKTDLSGDCVGQALSTQASRATKVNGRRWVRKKDEAIPVGS